jgi:hypothetical protein
VDASDLVGLDEPNDVMGYVGRTQFYRDPEDK